MSTIDLVWWGRAFTILTTLNLDLSGLLGKGFRHPTLNLDLVWWARAFTILLLT
jgi:hypothetical protein